MARVGLIPSAQLTRHPLLMLIKSGNLRRVLALYYLGLTFVVELEVGGEDVAEMSLILLVLLLQSTCLIEFDSAIELGGITSCWRKWLLARRTHLNSLRRSLFKYAHGSGAANARCSRIQYTGSL